MAATQRFARSRTGARGSSFSEVGRAGRPRAVKGDYPPIFETAARTRLLVAVAVNEPVSLHELRHILGLSKGAAHPAIEHCRRLGIVVRRSLERPAPSEFLIRGRYCLNQRHPLYGDVRALLLALDAAMPIGRVRRAGVGPLGDVVGGRQFTSLDYLFGKPCRTRAIAFVSLLGVVDPRLFEYLWGMNRDTVRKSFESMELVGFLRGKIVSGTGRGPIRRTFRTYRIDAAVPALDELRALARCLARLKPQYGVLAREAKKMRSYLRDHVASHERRTDRGPRDRWP